MDTFLSCSAAFAELEDATLGSDEGSAHEYTEVDDWRGRLIMFLTLSPSRAIDIGFDLPEKVLDTSNVQQSGGFGVCFVFSLKI